MGKIMEQRIETDKYFMEIATTVAKRSTCLRRSVGCVLVDSKNHIVATGYNGVPKGFEHCLDSPCEGGFAVSGTDLDLCNAIHAEVNAFLQLRSDDKLTAYVTTTPCFSCAKMIANTNVERIVAKERYAHRQALIVLGEAGIQVEVLDIDKELIGVLNYE